MQVSKLSLSNIGGVVSAEIDFSQRMNIICGPNGVGKSTILDTIAHFFIRRGSRHIKRNVGAQVGRAVLSLSDDGQIRELNFKVEGYEPELENHFYQDHVDARKLIYVRSNRNFEWAKLNAVLADPETNDYVLGERNIRGIAVEDTKNWIVNRFLYSAHENALSPNQIRNFDLAKKSFTVLDSNFTFSHVLAKTNEIIINTPSGSVFFEYLSSGFKASVSIFVGIIKEIEYRFSGEGEAAEKFDGIILIDEVETHLHPVWQTKILNVLKELFPYAQFIISTHSPHVIQGAGSGEVISLAPALDRQETVRLRAASRFGYQLWSIEEILSDVMGMRDARSEAFRHVTDAFRKAIEGGDKEAAQIIFDEIRSSLHPASPLNVIMPLQIQAAIEADNDQN